MRNYETRPIRRKSKEREMSSRGLDWTGEPLVYKDPTGSGVIVRSFHYVFDDNGRIKAVTPVTRPVLKALVEKHPTYSANPGTAMATYLSKGGFKAEKGQAAEKEKKETSK
jgi:hypothetical protein